MKKITYYNVVIVIPYKFYIFIIFCCGYNAVFAKSPKS